jgi:hypothetical protein
MLGCGRCGHHLRIATRQRAVSVHVLRVRAPQQWARRPAILPTSPQTASFAALFRSKFNGALRHHPLFLQWWGRTATTAPVFIRPILVGAVAGTSYRQSTYSDNPPPSISLSASFAFAPPNPCHQWRQYLTMPMLSHAHPPKGLRRRLRGWRLSGRLPDGSLLAPRSQH